MPRPLQCPQCGATEATLLQDNIYQCKSCGLIYDFNDINPEPQTSEPAVATVLEGETPKEVSAGILKFVIIGVVLLLFVLAGSFFLILKNKHHSSSSVSNSLLKNYTETISSFTVVNTTTGLQVWTVSQRNSDGLTSVGFFLNQVDPVENKIVKSVQIGKNITWKQSFEDSNKMGQLKTIGTVGYLISGNDLLGYDVNTQEQVMNKEKLMLKFPELKQGFVKVEDINDADGFELTSGSGRKFYYLPLADKLITEKAYWDKSKTDTEETDKIEYCFSNRKRQQLYKISRKTGKLFYKKIDPQTLNDILLDEGEAYKKKYKIFSLGEFTPGEIYFNGNVLYRDNDKIVIAYQAEIKENAAVIVKCFNKDKKVLWTRSGKEMNVFMPLLKSASSENIAHGDQLAIIQPYQVAIGINNVNGKILWTFKP